VDVICRIFHTLYSTALYLSFYGVPSLVLIVLSWTSDLGLNWDMVGPVCGSPLNKMFVYDVVMTS